VLDANFMPAAMLQLKEPGLQLMRSALTKVTTCFTQLQQQQLTAWQTQLVQTDVELLCGPPSMGP